MKITPLDIQHRVFKTQMRGYHIQQVDHFLEEVAQTVEALTRENTTMREKLAGKEDELAELRKTEAALTNTLVTTQNFVEQLKSGAQQDADLILKEAELKAEEILAQSRTQLIELQRNLADLRRQRALTLEHIRSTLRSFERLLEIEEGESTKADLANHLEPSPDAPPFSKI